MISRSARQADYCACMFSSSLFNDGPIGGGFCGVNFDSSNSLKHLKYLFLTPSDINRTYTFNYQVLDSDNPLRSGHYGILFFLIC